MLPFLRTERNKKLETRWLSWSCTGRQLWPRWHSQVLWKLGGRGQAAAPPPQSAARTQDQRTPLLSASNWNPKQGARLAFNIHHFLSQIGTRARGLKRNIVSKTPHADETPELYNALRSPCFSRAPALTRLSSQWLDASERRTAGAWPCRARLRKLPDGARTPSWILASSCPSSWWLDEPVRCPGRDVTSQPDLGACVFFSLVSRV